MAYACDKLYDEVIRKMMADLSTKVKVREIIVYLPCLTISDREEIEAKRDTAGNYCAMSVLIDNLRRRENWPIEFISALKKCEQWDLADRISKDYDRIRGIPTQRTKTFVASVSPASLPAPTPAPTAATPIPAVFPAEASATVTKATIHMVPHSSPALPTPSVETEVYALVSDAQVHTPASAHPAVPPQVFAADARSCSPVSAPALTPSIGQSVFPVDAKESSKLSISGASLALIEAPALVSVLDMSVQPNQEPADLAEPPLIVLPTDAMSSSPVSAPRVTPSVEQNKVLVIPRETPILDISSGLTNTAPSGHESSIAPMLPTTRASPSSQVNKHTTMSQSSASQKREVPLSISSSVKHPIQDSNPPGNDLPRDSQNNTTINQVGERVHTALSPNCQTQETSQARAQAPPSTSTDAVAGCLTNFSDSNEENFSKPGVLRGEEPFSVTTDLSLQISHVTMDNSSVQPAGPLAVPIPHRGEEPFNTSVTTDNLMISSSTTTFRSQSVSAPVQNSSPGAFRNGFPGEDSSSYPHQPVEDYYESLQAEQGTREHIVKFSEQPSLKNLNAQPSSMVRQTITGLSHNSETVSLVLSDSEAHPSQKISHSIPRNNSWEQVMPAASLTSYAEPASATFQESELNASSQNNIPQLEQREEFHGLQHRIKSNSHLIAAAAIGVTALFVALRLKY
ncbi:mitochondrial antiviral-signaling protein [Tachysurus fulvidraco]|uniref:mitochondrial antiviral-signaling protein n=1 Tax=Tachysurus fulvidraco TaxID=1234273 RepID=UPI000F4F8EA9|nr:mitochondrial antiviral-signaling protein [Tachysurus fulvidraco]